MQNACRAFIFGILAPTSPLPTGIYKAKHSRDWGVTLNTLPLWLLRLRTQRVDAGLEMELMKCCVCTSRCGGTHDSELMRLLQRSSQVGSARAGVEEQKRK